MKSINDKDLPKIICILGPTGSGKNKLALDLAGCFPVQVINFDSRQVYQGLPIITAQPGSDELQVCPHHLYGFLKPDKGITAGGFVELAKESIEKVSRESGVPVLVGGTGLYLRSLVHGLADIPPVPEDVRRELQEQCRKQGPESLFQELQLIDPSYAAKISPRDRQRITRALEVFHSTGCTMSSWHENQPRKPFYRVLKLGVHVEWKWLVHGLHKRIQKMLLDGAVQEVRSVCREYGFNRSLPAMTGIGCREVLAYLAGEIDMHVCIERWFKNTRDYAKRQLTWFKKEPGVNWVSPEEPDLARQAASRFLGVPEKMSFFQAHH